MAKSLKAGSATGVSAPLQPHGKPFETACRDIQALKGLLDQGKKNRVRRMGLLVYHWEGALLRREERSCRL